MRLKFTCSGARAAGRLPLKLGVRWCGRQHWREQQRCSLVGASGWRNRYLVGPKMCTHSIFCRTDRKRLEVNFPIAGESHRIFHHSILSGCFSNPSFHGITPRLQGHFACPFFKAKLSSLLERPFSICSWKIGTVANLVTFGGWVGSILAAQRWQSQVVCRRCGKVICMPSQVVFLVAPYCAIPRDYLSDTPLWRAMGFLASQHGQLGAIPPPPFSQHFPLESMRSGGAIPPPLKTGISAIFARYPTKTRQLGAIPPSAILSRKGIARYGGVSRTGPLRTGTATWSHVRILGVVSPRLPGESLRAALVNFSQSFPRFHSALVNFNRFFPCFQSALVSFTQF